MLFAGGALAKVIGGGGGGGGGPAALAGGRRGGGGGGGGGGAAAPETAAAVAAAGGGGITESVHAVTNDTAVGEEACSRAEVTTEGAGEEVLLESSDVASASLFDCKSTFFLSFGRFFFKAFAAAFSSLARAAARVLARAAKAAATFFSPHRSALEILRPLGGD